MRDYPLEYKENHGWIISVPLGDIDLVNVCSLCSENMQKHKRRFYCYEKNLFFCEECQMNRGVLPCEKQTKLNHIHEHTNIVEVKIVN